MEKFPQYISPENKENFTEIRRNIILKQLRQDIHDLILVGNENDFFDLAVFDNRHLKNKVLTKELCDIVIEELEAMGWRTKLSYADTGLFIYSSENPPPGAW